MEDLLLSESEYRVMDEVWNNAPVGSGELVKILGRKYDWKKSTTYTMLKRLADKGLVKNEDSKVTYLVPRSSVQLSESKHLVQRSFGGSLSAFVSAFLGSGSVTQEDAEELINLIESHFDEK